MKREQEEKKKKNTYYMDTSTSDVYLTYIQFCGQTHSNEIYKH